MEFYAPRHGMTVAGTVTDYLGMSNLGAFVSQYVNDYDSSNEVTNTALCQLLLQTFRILGGGNGVGTLPLVKEIDVRLSEMSDHQRFDYHAVHDVASLHVQEIALNANEDNASSLSAILQMINDKSIYDVNTVTKYIQQTNPGYRYPRRFLELYSELRVQKQTEH